MKKFKKYLARLGPGFVTGASDDDPSGIATYSQAGAQFGLATLWMALITFPLMSTIQEMCGRIGMVTAQGLAQNIKQHYPKPLLIFIVTGPYNALPFQDYPPYAKVRVRSILGGNFAANPHFWGLIGI